MPSKISLIITTFGTDTLYSQACLESIRKWKNDHHEVIVVSHDESPLLRAYLEANVADGLIDKLLYAIPGHGHTRGFNLGLKYAQGETVFNISNDILIGPLLVDYCAWDLLYDKQLGMVGWHWYSDGVRWNSGKIVDYVLRSVTDPYLSPQHETNIRNARWFTGRYFEGIGGPYWLHVCNTSFFGMKRELLNYIGGFGKEYTHYWADDFLSYAVLDQGLDVRHFDKCFRCRPYFLEFQNENLDVDDRRRRSDTLCFEDSFLSSLHLESGDISDDEAYYMYLLAKGLSDNSIVTCVGICNKFYPVILLDALRDKKINFNFLDNEDTDDFHFRKRIQQYVAKNHIINPIHVDIERINSIPESDLIFIDVDYANLLHWSDLAESCLNKNGVIVFYDRGYSKPILNQKFNNLRIFHKIIVYYKSETSREQYVWP